MTKGQDAKELEGVARVMPWQGSTDVPVIARYAVHIAHEGKLSVEGQHRVRWVI